MEPNVDPFCNFCLKPSPVKFERSIGLTGAKLIKAGWLYKNAILFTGANKPLCFCSNECKDTYYKEVLGVTEEQNKSVLEWSNKCKEDFKKDIPKIIDNMSKIQEFFNKFKTK